MNRMVLSAIACAIIALSSTIQAAQPVSETPSARLALTHESCAAAAVTNRARCLKPANAVVDQSQDQCLDAVNVRQRVCMIEVLEALHPGLGRTPAERN